jgi:hypothetical protein
MSTVIPFRRQSPEPALQTCHYLPASIHESVPTTALVAALVCRGLTVSNVAGIGLVIHQIGQDPHLPARRP